MTPDPAKQKVEHKSLDNGVILPSQDDSLYIIGHDFKLSETRAKLATDIAHIAFKPGTLVDERFIVKCFLGRGGECSVVLAIPVGEALEEYDDPVAIRFFRNSINADWELRKRVEHSFDKALEIDSPHVMDVYEYSEHRGYIFQVVELLLEEDTNSYLLESQERGLTGLPVDMVTQIGIDVCSGLANLHNRGWIHRDIKPKNIIFSKTKYRATIVDHDLIFDSECDRCDELLDQEAELGTRAFMSPEQLQGDLRLDPRSDIYSLGATLYTLLTGEDAFESWTRTIENRPEMIRDPRENNPAVSTSFSNVIMKAAAHYREHRYQSVEEFAAALKAVT